MDGINNFRIKFDKAVDYSPVASFINNSIDLIQRQRFSHKNEMNLSDYQRHIVHKTKSECLVKMIPFGAIFWRIFHKNGVEANIQEDESFTMTSSSALSPTKHKEVKPRLNTSTIVAHEQIESHSPTPQKNLPQNALFPSSTFL